jgi:lysophospholipase L1-like esterase
MAFGDTGAQGLRVKAASSQPRFALRRVAPAAAALAGIGSLLLCGSCSARSGESPQTVPDPMTNPYRQLAIPLPSAATEPAPSPMPSASVAAPPAASASSESVAAVRAIPAEPARPYKLVELRKAALKRVLGRTGPVDARVALYELSATVPPDRPNPAEAVHDIAAKMASLAVAAEFDRAAAARENSVRIENQPALEHFYRALADLEAGQDQDGKVRILVYGASHAQADIYPGYVRAYLQSRFGDGGQGFVLLGQVNRWYRTLDTTARHERLTVLHARYRLDVQDEPLGLFGAALVGRTRDTFGEITTSRHSRNTRFEVQYFMQPEGGDFRVELDGYTIARIGTKAETPTPAYHAFEATPGQHTIRVRLNGNGPVRLFGIVAETAAPGIVVDTLAINGSKLANQLCWHEGFWAEAVRHRDPDLVILDYGTNEVIDPGYSLAKYERQLRAVLGRLRAAVPNSSCLLMAPFDLPKRRGRDFVTHPRLLEVVDLQRRISNEFGCGLWNGYAFMGGAGSFQRWIAAKPPLASVDRIHLTTLGYAYVGLALADALMWPFDLERGSEPANSSHALEAEPN